MKANARILMWGVITACLSFLGVAHAQTVTNWSENFDDGNGNNRWYADNGVWQIGTPTIGPGAAHSTNYCAGTGLTANYPVGANSRLIRFQSFVVPSANQFPRLRFWQWYIFSGSCNGSSPDYGVVEVKGTNGVWQSVSPGYTGNGGGWTYASVDLSAYAGQTVQVAFHFVFQNGCSSTSPGWYVDDVSLVTGTPVFNNPEGFEGGIGDWYAESGSWQVGVPTSGPGAAHSGTNCAATVLNGNYPVGANSRFVSPAFVVPSASSSPYLRFWHWYNFSGSCNGSSPDLGVVEVRGTNGTWQTLSSQYTGNSSGWTEPALDLSAYAGQTVQVAFHFVFQNGCGSTSPGWYVDDVSIQSFGQPTILSPPASQTLSVGSSATLNVGASGDSPLSYQWRYNSNAIAGATNTTLPLTNVQLSQAGYYDVVVTNDAGSVTSTPPALLQVVISFGGVDIGDPGAPGNFTQSNGVYTVTGSGEQLSGTADAFYFIQQPLSGNCQIVARVTGLLGPAGAQAGIMIRETLDDGSKHASLLVDSSTNVVFRRRLTNDAYSVDTDYSRTNRAWLRLMRMGNDFVGLCSTNGTNWEYVWFTTISMSNQVQVGLAVTAHYNASYATATMDNVSIGSLSPLPTWSLPAPMILLGGESWTPAEFQRVGGFDFLLGSAAGDYFTVKGTTNIGAPFASWPALGTVTNTYGVLPFLDVGALTNALQFYRMQRLGP
jgi:regulation of enolase protein 1 (concanavalin A-like superfamily)